MRQPAFPKENRADFWLCINKGLQCLWRVGLAGGRGHHAGEAWILKFQGTGPVGNSNIDCARNNAVRMDMPRMRAAGLQDIDPQAIQLGLAAKIKMTRFRKGTYMLVQYAS